MLLQPDRDDATAEADAALDLAEQLAPGVELQTELLRIVELPMAADAAIRVCALWERVAGWVSVQQMRAQCAAMRHAGGDGQAAESMVTELATSTGQSDSSMGRQVADAAGITCDLPTMTAAVESGALTVKHAKALDAVVGNLDPDLRRQVEDLVVPVAVGKHLTPFQLRKAAERAVLRLDPDGAADRAAQAKHRDSDVRYRTLGDGLASLTAIGDDVLLRAVADAIDDKARQLKVEGRPPAAGTGIPDELGWRTPADAPLGVRRVNALARLALGDEQVDRPNVEVAVTIDAATLLALTTHPATVSGVGSIPARFARWLASDGTWRRLVTDPLTGHAIDLGYHAYKPSRALKRLLAAVHGTCRFPGCTKRATHIDNDHIINYLADGGTTNLWKSPETVEACTMRSSHAGETTEVRRGVS